MRAGQAIALITSLSLLERWVHDQQPDMLMTDDAQYPDNRDDDLSESAGPDREMDVDRDVDMDYGD